MTSPEFRQVVEWLVPGIEGGYVNDPRDPGGETKYGISKRAYPNVDIPSLTIAGANEIYLLDYWAPSNCDKMPFGVAVQVFDMRVNAGPAAAFKCLQRAAGIKDDGVYGPATERVAQLIHPCEIARHRMMYYSMLPGWTHYKRSWTHRIFSGLELAWKL